MSPSSRLRMVEAITIVTLIYSVLIAVNSSMAKQIMLGYCGIVLTVVIVDRFSRSRNE